MTKGKLIKGIVCGLMLTAVVGTTAFAGSYSEEVYAYNRNIRKEYTGSVGKYSAVGTDTTAYVIAVNNTHSSRLYRLEYAKYHNGIGEYIDIIADSAVLTYYQSKDVVGGRLPDDTHYHYLLTARAYNSIAEATGQADYFSYKIKQY